MVEPLPVVDEEEVPLEEPDVPEALDVPEVDADPAAVLAPAVDDPDVVPTEVVDSPPAEVVDPVAEAPEAETVLVPVDGFPASEADPVVPELVSKEQTQVASVPLAWHC